MDKFKKILFLFVGKDKWNEEIHDNKNIIAVESIKTATKLRILNKTLYHDKDTAFMIAKAMGVIR